MDIIGEFVKHLFLELKPILDWAVNHWAITMVLLIALIYWAARQKRINGHHL